MSNSTDSDSAESKALEYPETRTGDTTDDFFGTTVADPYRWLEDLDGEETAAWVAAQNSLSAPYLEATSVRDEIEQRLTELWNHERFSQPAKEGSLYFFMRNDGLQNQDVLYVANSLDAEPRVLLDPNTFREDGTVSLAGLEIGPEAKFVAYAKSDGGSDWRSWHVRSIADGSDLDDTLVGTKFSGVSWTKDGKAFYYSRYPEKDGEYDDQQSVSVYRHALGTEQSADQQVYSIPEHPRRNPYATVSEDGRYLVLSVQEGYLTNAVYYQELGKPGAPVVELLDDWDARYDFLGNQGATFFFKTNLEAPKERVLAIDLARPERGNWREIIPQSENTLESVSLVGGRLVASYLEDVKPVVQVFGLDGALQRTVELPGMGSVGGFGGHEDDPETFYTFTSFATPPTIYRYDVTTGESSLFRKPDVDIDEDAYDISQVFYQSKDGTRVPMFLFHQKGLELDGNNPTLLYGYGGFNISLTPGFSVARMVWVERGGVLAVPNLRGGGEYGKDWHLAGTKLQKQNVFDDFIAAAEYLIAEGYTSTPHLAIQGGSNGGLLVGAALTQRPDLFGAALPAVGVLDMLRYHLASANARNWSTDYGLSENQDEFEAQLAYSPYHNIRPGACYPPTLVTTADHDDRVVPWHSFKFAARLQAAQGCNHPILTRIETRAGHGAGTPTKMRIENIADEWAFVLRHIG
jgi:prolyl oligopeptidase